MTANQIAFQQMKETKRHNQADELEKMRHNYVTETETQRHNIGTEQAQLTKALGNPLSLGSYLARWEQNPIEGIKHVPKDIWNSLKKTGESISDGLKSLFR